MGEWLKQGQVDFKEKLIELGNKISIDILSGNETGSNAMAYYDEAIKLAKESFGDHYEDAWHLGLVPNIIQN